MRWFVPCLALCTATGCAFDWGTPSVWFEMGKIHMVVDSSGGYGYANDLRAPIIARGRDSAGVYVVSVWLSQGVSLKAGQKPESFGMLVTVRDGQGEIHFRDFTSRCDQYAKSDCIPKWIDPEYTFKLLGYVPVQGGE